VHCPSRILPIQASDVFIVFMGKQVAFFLAFSGDANHQPLKCFGDSRFISEKDIRHGYHECHENDGFVSWAALSGR
jgi:hypothetical protein